METLEETLVLGPEGIPFTADRTGLAGVMRVNVDNPNTPTAGFIVDKILELPESPIIGQPIQSLASPPSLNGYPPSDPLKVFHHNTVSTLKRLNYLLAYLVVHTSHKPCLPSAHSFKLPSGGRGAFGLKNPPQSIKSVKLPLNSLKKSVVAGHRKIVYSNINSYGMLAVSNRVDVFGNNHMEEQLTLPVDEIRCPNNPTEILQEVLRDCDRDLNSAFDGAEGNHVGLEGEGSGIIANTKQLLAKGLRRFFSLSLSCPDRFKHLIRFISAAYDKLGGEIQHLTDSIVGGVVELKFAEVSIIACINHMLGGIRILSHSFQENLIQWQTNLYHSVTFQGYLLYPLVKYFMVEHWKSKKSNGGDEGGFLPRLKPWVSSARF